MLNKKKIIAFSLWGDSPKYTVGALKNAQIASHLFPEWICRFYVGNSTPDSVIETLSKLNNVEVVKIEKPGGWEGSVWRFLAVADSEVEIVLSRDTDSRLSQRERDAVYDWLASGKSLHVMRDHPYHSQWPILAGMWGVRCDRLRNIAQILEENFFRNTETYQWGVDQIFLGRFIHPKVCTDILVHDELSPPLLFDIVSERRNFPTPRQGLEFVGEVFDENDKSVKQDVDALQAFLKNKISE